MPTSDLDSLNIFGLGSNFLKNLDPNAVMLLPSAYLPYEISMKTKKRFHWTRLAKKVCYKVLTNLFQDT
jgi:hypothetical protein